MERCFGGDLATFLSANKRPLNELVVKKILLDLARGLHTLYQKNLVHRDLKPANLLIDAPSTINPNDPLANMGTVKLADFGFARQLNQGALAETLCGYVQLLPY
jgi:serine/threonine-protein kinase ULK/ATG1